MQHPGCQHFDLFKVGQKRLKPLEDHAWSCSRMISDPSTHCQHQNEHLKKSTSGVPRCNIRGANTSISSKLVRSDWNHSRIMPDHVLEWFPTRLPTANTKTNTWKNQHPGCQDATSGVPKIRSPPSWSKPTETIWGSCLIMFSNGFRPVYPLPTSKRTTWKINIRGAKKKESVLWCVTCSYGVSGDRFLVTRNSFVCVSTELLLGCVG